MYPTYPPLSLANLRDQPGSQGVSRLHFSGLPPKFGVCHGTASVPLGRPDYPLCSPPLSPLFSSSRFLLYSPPLSFVSFVLLLCSPPLLSSSILLILSSILLYSPAVLLLCSYHRSPCSTVGMAQISAKVRSSVCQSLSKEHSHAKT